jgi:hypothetical protein
MNSPYEDLRLTTSRDSGAGAYSKGVPMGPPQSRVT